MRFLCDNEKREVLGRPEIEKGLERVMLNCLIPIKVRGKYPFDSIQSFTQYWYMYNMSYVLSR